MEKITLLSAEEFAKMASDLQKSDTEAYNYMSNCLITISNFAKEKNKLKGESQKWKRTSETA